ncbi:hypothetical protein [uncultured Winogradskyella sp.]|uniref:hypothetical protein n=1 Tax=uncultured Winogradskyella sp. TaxID=395353 RepID=UPI002621C2E3|nr:hypothetical protein [uncultured Winogradskyella sp.]
MKRKIVLLFFTTLFFVRSNAQCAMCRAVLESGEDQSAAEGINDGIMFLMAVPYILVATIAFFIYRKYRNSNKTENTS